MFKFSTLFLAILLSATTHAQSTNPDSNRKAFNPDIGINFLGLLQRGSGISTDRTVVPHNGISLQESELQFAADVDTYFRAVANFAIKQEDGSVEYAIDAEDVYVETISLPAVTLKGGKFKLALGRHNLLHTHAFPFIDAPLIHQLLLGDEGLSEAAVSGSLLLPTKWFSEITVQGFNPSNEDSFSSHSSSDIGGLARFRNLWEFSDALTMEIGAAGAVAQNVNDRGTRILQGDLTFKWKPLEASQYHSLIWSSEYLHGKRNGFVEARTSEDRSKAAGAASWFQYNFTHRWWAQVRGEYIGIIRSSGIPIQNKESALLGFFPSEFSGLRLQYDYTKTVGEKDPDHTIAFQFNISFGAHPAHSY